MILTKDSVEEVVRREAGGKGYNLYLLTKAKYNVPAWTIISADLFRQYITDNDISTRIQDLLQNITRGLTSTTTASKCIKDYIINAKISEKTAEQVTQAYQHCASEVVAVRSSGLSEDLPGYSFAGQFDSFLNLNNSADVITSVISCWASAFSERVISYRLQKKLPLEIESMYVAVVIQKMIVGEKSGVVFSTDPREEEQQAVINAVFGLNENLVSGKIEPDTYIVGKQIIGKVIIDTQVLLDNQIELVASTAQKIEKLYSYPQDIEWTISKDILYILQSRPITTNIAQLQGKLAIWDNSNIIESYSGITLPLTYTFARFVYHQVYVQFCELLHLPKKEVKHMNYFLSNMLGLFYGRVYYNLLNWYRLTSILPGYSLNREFMETMMGTKKSIENEVAARVMFTPTTYGKRWARVIKIVTGLAFVFNHFRIEKKIGQFLIHFNVVYSQYRHKNYSLMSVDEQFEAYFDLEQRMLRKWKEPIINDFLCMVHFGLLKRLSSKWLPTHKDIVNGLLCGVGNIESTLPTKMLLQLANQASKKEALKKCILDTDSRDSLEAVKQLDEEYYKKIEEFRAQFGYRCMNEMKLETQDLYEDSSFIFDCLKNYLRHGRIDLIKIERNEEATRKQAQDYLDRNLSRLKRIVFIWVAKNAESSIRRREHLRFCRTKIYGVMRAIFNGIGKQYALRGIIDSPKDIFYLELQEVLGSYDGTLTVFDIKRLILLRKETYESYKNKVPKRRFVTRGPVYWNNSDIFDKLKKGVGTTEVLKGIACSSGIVEAKIKVVTGNEKDLELNGEILVAERTDPGWIPLYPSISGLIIERGGLLSHSAIVAREMGIPTIVGLSEATKFLQSGMTVKMDGETGEVYLLTHSS